MAQALEFEDGLLDLRSVEDLILPASMEQPEDAPVRVTAPDSPQDWSVQVRLLLPRGLLCHLLDVFS